MVSITSDSLRAEMVAGPYALREAEMVWKWAGPATSCTTSALPWMA